MTASGYRKHLARRLQPAFEGRHERRRRDVPCGLRCTSSLFLVATDDDRSERFLPEVQLGLEVAFGSRGQALAQYIEKRYEQRRQRTEHFVDEAGRHAEIDAEALLRAVVDDERLADLFEQAISAAEASSDDRKVRALARAFAAAVCDDTQIEASRVVVSAIRELDVPHTRVLALLKARGAVHDGQSVPMVALVSAIHSDHPAVIQPLLATLERLGLIRDTAFDNLGLAMSAQTGYDTSPEYRLTSFGEMVRGCPDRC
jgi:hypothetical protein